MDILDGSGLWSVTSGGAVPPLGPARVPLGSAYGPEAEGVDWERVRREDEEIVAVLAALIGDDA